jgi:hypothetical protein
MLKPNKKVTIITMLILSFFLIKQSLIILMTFSFGGKFPLTVSNTWSTTELFINEGLPEIDAFKKKLVSL